MDNFQQKFWSDLSWAIGKDIKIYGQKSLVARDWIRCSHNIDDQFVIKKKTAWIYILALQLQIAVLVSNWCNVNIIIFNKNVTWCPMGWNTSRTQVNHHQDQALRMRPFNIILGVLLVMQVGGKCVCITLILSGVNTWYHDVKISE